MTLDVALNMSLSPTPYHRRRPSTDFDSKDVLKDGQRNTVAGGIVRDIAAEMDVLEMSISSNFLNAEDEDDEDSDIDSEEESGDQAEMNESSSEQPVENPETSSPQRIDQESSNTIDELMDIELKQQEMTTKVEPKSRGGTRRGVSRERRTTHRSRSFNKSGPDCTRLASRSPRRDVDRRRPRSNNRRKDRSELATTRNRHRTKSPKISMDRSSQEHIRRRQENRSNLAEAAELTSNILDLQHDPVRRRRNRRGARSNPRDRQNEQMAASLSYLDIDREDYDFIMHARASKSAVSEPGGSAKSCGDDKITRSAEEGSKSYADADADGTQKTKKKGMIATLKKTFLADNAKNFLEAPTKKGKGLESDNVTPRKTSGVPDDEEIDPSVTKSDGNFSAEGTPNKERQRRRNPPTRSPNVPRNLNEGHAREQRLTEYGYRKKGITAAVTNAVAQTKELNPVENKEPEKMTIVAKDTANEAAVAAQALLSDEKARVSISSGGDEKYAGRTSRGRKTRSQASGATRARRHREGIGEVVERKKTPLRTASQAAAAEAAARARLRARKMGISLGTGDDKPRQEDAALSEKQRLLHDRVMVAATLAATTKLQSRKVVKSISTEAAIAASKRHLAEKIPSHVLPAELKRDISGKEAQLKASLRKIRKGAKARTIRRTRSGTSGVSRDSVNTHESRGGVQYPKVSPLALKRQPEGDEVEAANAGGRISKDRIQRSFLIAADVDRLELNHQSARLNNKVYLGQLSTGTGDDSGGLSNTSGHTAPPALQNLMNIAEPQCMLGNEFSADEE